ncbi:MAG: hypothetical protein EOO00_06065 [Chitinophagaceae bacterium]|nr:MAG: hypothetical protein EOO00_06065 [Chitinophagaceae bacterium]
MMIHILCYNLTNRLAYTLNFIFKDVLQANYKVISDVGENPDQHPMICYGSEKIEGAFHIPGSEILDSDSITSVVVEAVGTGKDCILFPAKGPDINFDIFGAVFYLISRYEEYLAYEEDLYKRFPHTSSIAFKHGFLNYPIVDKWINGLAAALKRYFPALNFPARKFSHLPSYDIDMAWAFRYKGILRNLGGWIRRPRSERLKVLFNLSPDPFDSFTFLKDLHKKFELRPIYFWLVARERGRLDKNISPRVPAMKKLISGHSEYENGLHPSWHSHTSVNGIQEEKQLLEEILQKPITASRQHYLRFRLPETYEALICAGISNEYSMGYGSINGFRASTASSFNWFNLRANEETTLKIHPFGFMDANSLYEQRQTPEQSFIELMEYVEVCRQEGCRLITVFHNNFLGSADDFRGWKEMYERFIQEVHS